VVEAPPSDNEHIWIYRQPVIAMSPVHEKE
jgi:hypothetical protein